MGDLLSSSANADRSTLGETLSRTEANHPVDIRTMKIGHRTDRVRKYPDQEPTESLWARLCLLQVWDQSRLRIIALVGGVEVPEFARTCRVTDIALWETLVCERKLT